MKKFLLFLIAALATIAFEVDASKRSAGGFSRKPAAAKNQPASSADSDDNSGTVVQGNGVFQLPAGVEPKKNILGRNNDRSKYSGIGSFQNAVRVTKFKAPKEVAGTTVPVQQKSENLAALENAQKAIGDNGSIAALSSSAVGDAVAEEHTPSGSDS